MVILLKNSEFESLILKLKKKNQTNDINYLIFSLVLFGKFFFGLIFVTGTDKNNNL